MTPFRTSSVAAVLLLGSLAAQQPAFTTFGTPCSVLAPPLAARNLPRIGQTFELEVLSGETVRPGSYDGSATTAVLVAGTSRTSWQGLPLPWSPAVIQTMGAFSCGDLSISPEALRYLPYSWPRTPVVVSLPVPNAPALVGTSVFFQAVDFGLNRRFTMGITMGVAAEARIGV